MTFPPSVFRCRSHLCRRLFHLLFLYPLFRLRGFLSRAPVEGILLCSGPSRHTGSISLTPSSPPWASAFFSVGCNILYSSPYIFFIFFLSRTRVHLSLFRLVYLCFLFLLFFLPVYGMLLAFSPRRYFVASFRPALCLRFSRPASRRRLGSLAASLDVVRPHFQACLPLP